MAYPNFYPYQQPYYQQPMPDQLAQLRQNQFQQPQMQQMQTQQMQQPQQQMQTQQQKPGAIIWVQGKEGANACWVAPGESALMMDRERYAFYIKSVDQSGIPFPLRTFDYTERISDSNGINENQSPAEDYITRSEFNDLQKKLNALLASLEGNSRKMKEESGNGESTV